jgi:adenosine deaminase
MNPQPAHTVDIAALRKGELHAHFNGLISSRLVREILTEEAVPIPEGFNLDSDLVRDHPSASLSDYLKPWQVLRRIPRDPKNLTRMTDDAFQRLHANNVRFVELRSTVLYLAALQNCLVTDALERLIAVTQESAVRYGLQRGLILTVPRGDYSVVHLDTLLTAYRSLGCPSDIVGLDLAGDEDIKIPDELPSCFRAAKDAYDLGITIHAGETGNNENVVVAVNEFGADRIGHGTAAAQDPRLMDLLCQRDVCIEVCPISNRLTRAVKETEAHPLREFQRRAVPFVICSDNAGIHGRDLNDDYTVALAEGVEPESLQRMYDLAAKHAFLEVAP